MSTGIILGLGLLSIVIAFYITLNLPYWLSITHTRRQPMMKFIKKFHDPNYVIITPCVMLYAYGAYVFIMDVFT